MRKATGQNKKFNVVLRQYEHDALEALATLDNISKGQVVRQLIMAAHGHRVKGVFCCASGSACFVPQMHQINRGG